jgi:hypothetical protein
MANGIVSFIGGIIVLYVLFHAAMFICGLFAGHNWYVDTSSMTMFQK